MAYQPKVPEPEGICEGLIGSLSRVTVEELIRSRRTHNAYDERVLGPVHLGRAKGPDKAAPERAPLGDLRAYLQ